MQKILFILCFILAMHAHANCKVTDDQGNTINLKNPARRIITLAPDLTEIIYAINADPFLIAIIQNSDYPLAAKTKTLIGSYLGLDLEKIISLHPDLIITWGNMYARQLAVLKKLNISIYISNPKHLKDVAHTMQQLGCLTGTQTQANQQANLYLQHLEKIKQKYSQTKPIKVFYQIGAYSLITINKQSWINQAITLCGGKNIFAYAKFAAPEVSWEAVVNANPQVIINDTLNNNQWQTPWLRWSEISAVKHHHLYSISPDLLERASPRLLNGVELLCEALESARVFSRT